MKTAQYNICLNCHRITQIYFYRVISIHEPHFEGYEWNGPIKCENKDFYQSDRAYKDKKPDFLKWIFQRNVIIVIMVHMIGVQDFIL